MRFYVATRVYKPGSVLTAIYLGLKSLSGSSRLLETVGQTICFSTALLRDRVYIVQGAPYEDLFLHEKDIRSECPTHVTMGRVGYEPTFSPFPAAKAASSISLLHLSWGLPRRALPVILAL